MEYERNDWYLDLGKDAQTQAYCYSSMANEAMRNEDYTLANDYISSALSWQNDACNLTAWGGGETTESIFDMVFGFFGF